MYQLGLIGVGRMGEAILRGVLERKHYQPHEVCFYDASDVRTSFIRDAYEVHPLQSAAEVYSSSAITVLAVKPQNFTEVVNELAKVRSEAVLVSILAGISTSKFREAGIKRVVRAMPNTPGTIGRGITAVAKNPDIERDTYESVLNLLKSLGEVVEVEEKDINAVTALSGSGPAYVFRFVESLKEAGIKVGLSAELSQWLALATIEGSIALMRESGKNTAELIESVASPAGTTIEALKVLEDYRFKAGIMAAVEAAWKRAYELEK